MGETELGKPFSRRQFIDYLIGGSLGITLAGMGGAVLSYLWPTGQAEGATGPVEVGSTADWRVGEGRVVPYQNSYALVIRKEPDPNSFVAFSAVCTHLGCNVTWDAKRKQIICPCHAGVFDLNGNVVSGPPPKPLPPLKVTVTEGVIYLGG